MQLPTSIESCVLRLWSVADKASLIRNANNKKVWRNLTVSFPYPYTEADADSWIVHANRSGRSIHLAITLDGSAVGGIGAIAGEGTAEQTCQFGYWLGEPYWGKGIATAAAHAFVRHLQATRSFARLEAAVFQWNPASMRVLEKVGFSREGVLCKSVAKDGELIDSVMYAYVFAAVSQETPSK